MKRRRRSAALETCPHCGAAFKAGRPACPECGSDAQTGWRDAEEIDYQSVEIPDTYEELVTSGRSRPSRWMLLIVLVLVTALVVPYLLGLF
jgi:hypothetical protein